MKAALIGTIVLLGLLKWSSGANSNLKIKVMSDIQELNNDINSKVEATIANYGMVPYGKSIIGTVHLANPRNACSPLEPFKMSNHTDPNPVVIVERGGCTFVTKTHYAQLMGSKIVIVIDNIDEDENKIIMVDDGHGKDINIPTIMIDRVIGEKLLKYLKVSGNETAPLISISLSFDMPHPDNRVEYDYWMTSFDNKSYEFVRSMKSYHERLGDNVLFTPHYALWHCQYCESTNYSVESPNCVSNGRYCAPDPDGDGPLTGKDVVLEDLREICVYNKGGNKWWDYMIKFESCINQVYANKGKEFNVSDCSYRIVSEIGMDTKVIEKCVIESFDNSSAFTKADNNLLREEKKLFYGGGIQIWPSLIINQISYRGNFDPAEGVFEAICNGFDTPPDVCKDQPQPTGLSTGAIIAIIIACLSVFMCIMLFIYKRMIRREMARELQMQVNSAISQYYALNDSRTKK